MVKFSKCTEGKCIECTRPATSVHFGKHGLEWKFCDEHRRRLNQPRPNFRWDKNILESASRIR